jgi:SpoVK/Ycf46/Vps4 family AAA+-type ATPase
VDPTLRSALTSAVDADPENAALRLHLAELLLAAGETEAAREHARRLVGADPENDAAWRILHVTGDREPDPEPAAEPDRPAMAEIRPLRVVEDGDDVDVDFDLGEIERPKVTLADVGGLEDVKRRLNVAFLGPMRDARLREMYGKSMRGGLLLYGPPGCGKTFVARATAGELGARFIPVGLADILDMWLGKSEANVHQLFVTARRKAPCVIFLDEVDAIGQKRTQLAHSAGRGVVAQLLSELDGLDANDGVFVLGATNQPWDIDTALRRPGRFDRTLLVLPPDEAARRAIVEYHLQGRPTDGIDAAAIARATAGFSGADLAHLCDSAAETALERAIDTGEAGPITMSDLKRALKDVRPSTRAWFETARNAALFANQDGVYDDLIEYMKAHRLL